MSDFLRNFFENKEVRRDPNAKYAIQNNKWDRDKASKIADEIRECRVASNALSAVADTGHEALRDTLLALFKVRPELRDPKEIRPSFLINHRVESEMLELKEYEKLHAVTRGDDIAAGLACVDIEPELEILFDKLQEQQKAAAEMEQMLQDAEGTADSLEEMLAAAQAAAEAGDDQEAKNYQDQAEAMAEQLEALKKALEDASDSLEEDLDNLGPTIKQSLKEALESSLENAETISSFDSWSLQPGALKRLDPNTRLELSKKLQTEKFKRMAEVIGRMQSMAMSEQMNKVDWAQEEIFDVTKGDNLSRILPNEMLALSDEILELDWMRRFSEQNLLQYDLRGTETTQRGGILIAEDGSGSMAGEREIWAKAIGLALLKIAKMQKRPFTCIHFGGIGQYILFEFDTTKDDLQLTVTYGSTVKYYSGIEAVIEFADKGMNSGTDFVTPLSVGLDIMERDFQENGMTEADFLFLTDGECAVPPNFLEEFKVRQAELGFSMYGVAVCTNPKSEPLNTICDGFVASIKELQDLENMRPIFGKV